MKYGDPIPPEVEAEIAEYWRQRAEQDKALKKEEKRARNRRASKVRYARSVAEAKEQHRLAWHAARAKAKAKREQEWLQAQRNPMFKALGLTTPEQQDVFFKIQDAIVAKLVLLAVQGGYIAPQKTNECIAFLSGTSGKLIP